MRKIKEYLKEPSVIADLEYIATNFPPMLKFIKTAEKKFLNSPDFIMKTHEFRKYFLGITNLPRLIRDKFQDVFDRNKGFIAISTYFSGKNEKVILCDNLNTRLNKLISIKHQQFRNAIYFPPALIIRLFLVKRF